MALGTLPSMDRANCAVVFPTGGVGRLCRYDQEVVASVLFVVAESVRRASENAGEPRVSVLASRSIVATTGTGRRTAVGAWAVRSPGLPGAYGSASSLIAEPRALPAARSPRSASRPGTASQACRWAPRGSEAG